MLVTDTLGMSALLLPTCPGWIEHQLTSDIVESPYFMIENAHSWIKRILTPSNIIITIIVRLVACWLIDVPVIVRVGHMLDGSILVSGWLIDAPVIVRVGHMLDGSILVACWLFIDSVVIHCKGKEGRRKFRRFWLIEMQ
jgi:hypothetical protein